MAYGLENTIVVKGMGHHEEGVCDEICTPGMAVEMAADGEYDLASSATAGVKIVKEDALQGKTKDLAYAVDDVLFIYQPLPGDHLLVFCKLGENIAIGDNLVIEGGSGLFIEAAGAAELEIPLTSFMTHDSLAVRLPAAAATDDLGLVYGSVGTDGPTLQGVDFGATASDEEGAMEFVIPQSYKAGDTFTVRIRGGMLTTVSDTTATVDLAVHLCDEDGAVGSDLVTTAATTINSLTKADVDFVVTPTTLLPGSKIIIHVKVAGADTTNAGVMIIEISKVSIIADFAAGGSLWESLESTAGALAANDHVKARCLRI